MTEPNEEYLTVKELSRKIKFSKQSIYNLIFRKDFVLKEHYLKPRPKKILFKWSAVRAWMEKTTEQPSYGTRRAETDKPAPKSTESLIKI